MKFWILTMSLAFFFLDMPIRLFAEASEDSFFLRSIAKESLNIQHTSSYDHSKLSDLHASRGEDYLILGEDQKALEDFQLSYEFALNCREEENRSSFRPLFGAFLAHVRLENLESAQEIYVQLESILKDSDCCRSRESATYLGKCYSDGFAISNLVQNCNSNWPIFGPERIPVHDCLDNVAATVKAIKILTAAVRKTEVRVVANALIDQLAETANNCCWAGGLWKGCLQKLVNKLHYWKVLGIPADPAWDSE
jgi:hypothetical protein